MDERNEQDELWDLLGKARKTEASPYFTRKVLRAVQEERRPAFSMAFLLRWLAPASVCAAIVIGWSAYSWQKDEQTADFNACFDAAADMQSLVAQDYTSVWSDS
jgi:hypothetical protein